MTHQQQLPLKDTNLNSQCKLTATTSNPNAALLLLISPRSTSKPDDKAALEHCPYMYMLTAVVGSQGSQAWVLLAVVGACLVSSLEGDHQGSLGEAYPAASAQHPHSC